MGDFQNQKECASRRIKILTVCCIVLALTVIVLLIILWGMSDASEGGEMTVSLESTSAEQTSEGRRELIIYGTETQGEYILLKTSYGNLKYPYAFSDVIEVSAVNSAEARALEFTARLQTGKFAIYTIYFYEAKWTSIGTLQLAEDSQPQPVSVVFHEVPDTQKEDDLRTFQAAQDTFTEVWLSLAENEAFIPIESN